MPSIIFGLFSVSRVKVNGIRVTVDLVVPVTMGELIIRGLYDIDKEAGLNVAVRGALHFVTARVTRSLNGEMILNVCRVSPPLIDGSCKSPSQMIMIGEAHVNAKRHEHVNASISTGPDGQLIFDVCRVSPMYKSYSNHAQLVVVDHYDSDTFPETRATMRDVMAVAALSRAAKARFQFVLPLIKPDRLVCVMGNLDMLKLSKSRFSLSGLELNLLGGGAPATETTSRDVGDDWWIKNVAVGEIQSKDKS